MTYDSMLMHMEEVQSAQTEGDPHLITIINAQRNRINELEARVQTDEWIPCSERLPDDPDPELCVGSKTYQATNARGRVLALDWVKTIVRGKTVMRWEYADKVIYKGEIIAWKPLSEPYRSARIHNDKQ